VEGNLPPMLRTSLPVAFLLPTTTASVNGSSWQKSLSGFLHGFLSKRRVLAIQTVFPIIPQSPLSSRSEDRTGELGNTMESVDGSEACSA
jgi:hypothetical protein